MKNTNFTSSTSSLRGLCKGKRKDGGEWVKGYIVGDDIIIPFENDYILDEWHIHGWNAYEVVPESVCSFSFLLDSEGKEMYENDIVECYDGEELLCTFVVRRGVFGGGGVLNTQRFGYPAFAFAAYDKRTEQLARAGLRDDPAYWLENYTVKIIGNACNK